MSLRGFTRVAGYKHAQRSWACKQCNYFTSFQREACGYCGHREFHYFASEREAKRYRELLLLLAGRVIRDLEVHPEFALNAPLHDSASIVEIGKYVADFSYVEAATDEFVVEDVKPKSALAIDPLAKWKMRHVEGEYGIKVKIP